MSKKNKQKNRKTKEQLLAVNKVKSPIEKKAQKENVKELVEKSEQKKIKLQEKIDLEKSSHADKKLYKSRYSPYFKKIKSPLKTFLKIMGVLLGICTVGVIVVFLIFGRNDKDL